MRSLWRQYSSEQHEKLYSEITIAGGMYGCATLRRGETCRPRASAAEHLPRTDTESQANVRSSLNGRDDSSQVLAVLRRRPACNGLCSSLLCRPFMTSQQVRLTAVCVISIRGMRNICIRDVCITRYLATDKGSTRCVCMLNQVC